VSEAPAGAASVGAVVIGAWPAWRPLPPCVALASMSACSRPVAAKRLIAASR